MADDESKNTTGEIDPSIWDEAQAVTGRPQDEPEPNSTFGVRAKAVKKADVAKVDAPTKPASRKRKA